MARFDKVSMWKRFVFGLIGVFALMTATFAPVSAFATISLTAGEGDYPSYEQDALSLTSQAQQAMPDWKGSLFAKESSVYSNALALKAAEMSENAYGGDGNRENVNIKYMLEHYGVGGFDDFKSYNYAKNYSPSGDCTDGSNNSAFTVGHDRLEIGGMTYTVLVIVARGTTSFAEMAGDLNLFDITRKLNGYEVRKNDYDFYSEINKGVEDYVKSHSAVSKAAKKGKLKVLVTGHSLGGAAANLYAAHLNKEASKSGASWKRHLDKDDIYAYTFGAIKVFMDNANVEFGYENIHNVYNYYDSFGPHGSKEWLHVSDPKAKFGHADMFNIGKIEEGSNLLDAVHNHDMSRYIEALKAKSVKCSGKQQFKVVFKPNKGVGTMLPQVVTRNKSTALRAVSYQRAGYKFAGWNTRADGKGKAYADKAKVKNLAKAGKTVTLYAQRKRQTFDYSPGVPSTNRVTGRVNYSLKVGDKRFSATSLDSSNQLYKLTVKENGKTRVLAKRISNGQFVTNGKYIFFAMRGIKTGLQEDFTNTPIYKNVVYRMNVASGKKKILGSGTGWLPILSDGKYLYVSGYQSVVSGKGSLHSIEVSSNKAKAIYSGYTNNRKLIGGRLVFDNYHGGVGYTLFSYGPNGTNKRTISTSVWGSKPNRSKIVFIEGDVSSRPQKARAYECAANGTGKKPLSDWAVGGAAINELHRKYIS